MYTLENKVAIITGGADGIGAATAKEFLKEHAKYVAIIDINQAKGSALETELNLKHGEDKVKFYNCDVTNDDQLFDIFQNVNDEHGGIDVVVNNAGIARDDKKIYKKEIEINFTALVTSTLKALEIMRTDEGGKGGTIINVSSIGALGLYSPGVFVYAATKSAVLHFSTCIGMEEYSKHTNVRVLTICFGGTDTGIIQETTGIDKITTDSINQYLKMMTVQTVETAAQGLVHSFKIGKTGSTWVVDNNKTFEITNNIKEAYKIMSTNINI